MMSEKVISLDAWKGRLHNSKQGVKKNITNLMLHLENLREFGDKLRWNELAYRAEWNGKPVEDTDLIAMRVILEAHQFEPNVGDVLPAVMAHAKRNGYHPVRDYLDALKWDGKRRLDQWLHVCMGAGDNQFTRVVGRKSLISAVARAYKPGCKVDTVLILEGDQGIKKSSAIKRLFSDELTVDSVNLFDQHNKMVMAMMGSWVVEIAEFVAVLGKNQEHVKGLLSMQKDKVVLPYAKLPTEHPRQCVFVGTINPGDTGYFTDGTGNRRYWPVTVTKADLTLIESVRDQLWAEAVEAFRFGEAWWLEGEEEEALAKLETALREEGDAWDEILYEKLIRAGITETTVGAALQAIGVPNDRMEQKLQRRVAKALRRLGFTSKDAKEVGPDGKRRSVLLFERKGA